MAYWLLKSEPDAFSIDDLERVKVEPWNGVRNWSARNNLRAMAVGDLGFFYHSSCTPPGVAGIVRIVREAYPDETQFDPASKYFDPRAKPEKPRWYNPDVGFVAKYPRLVTLAEIKATPGLQDMALLRTFRLSVQPVTEQEWEIVTALAEGG